MVKLNYAEKKVFGVCSVDDQKFVNVELHADAADNTGVF